MPDTTADNPVLTLFATTNFRGVKRPFGIKLDDRRRHMYIIGKTGMGKSTMLENMIIQDIRAGRGLAVVDPHGDLVEKIVKFIPSYRVNDVVYLNPADADYPIAFNILETINPSQRHLVASGLIAVFKKLWIDSWGPRLEYILRNTILALIEYPGSTLLGVTRMLVDKEYRQKVVRHITDPIIKVFWQTEFTAYANQFRTEAVAPIQNKIGQFLSSSIIRNIVGQPKSTIDMREIMDNGKILLLNLAKGRIGEDNAALLGAMMITKLQVAAMSRIDVPENERRDFYLYVDEFQNFATESFANILSEARKYRLDLIIAHQYIEQLDETVRAAVFGNVGTLICFRVGAADAEFLAKEFFPVFTETDLVNLTKFDMYLKLMIDGVASEPFSATGLPPVDKPDELQDRIIRVSRERYAKQREVVEEKISRWSGMMVEAALQEGGRPEGRGRRESGGPGPAETRDGTPKPAVEIQSRQPVVTEGIPAPISLSQALRPDSPRPGPDRPRRDRRRPPRHRPPPRAPAATTEAASMPTATSRPPPLTPPSPLSPTPPTPKPSPLQPGQVVHPL
ncbi:MAG: type IV secretion system DNA-binding domain-containing protein [Candidatus Kerfeldbacteria bacterium]|nr:type IV secretion system DNA-binding domain-containing protein [Candidatus Kerfeldbacteria bacterium]